MEEMESIIETPYDTTVELSVSLRDVGYHFMLSANNFGQVPMKRSPKSLARVASVFWKPPGTTQWVLKGMTEPIYKNASPKYMKKFEFRFEFQDVKAILVRVDVHDVERHERNSDFLGSIYVKMDDVLSCGGKGSEFVLVPEIPDSPFLRDFVHMEPGRVYLRAEKSRVKWSGRIGLKVGLKRKTTSCLTRTRPVPTFYEIQKLNESFLFGLREPYTVIYRSETLPEDEDDYNIAKIPLDALCNGDKERVLKVAIFNPEFPEESLAFTLTTLRKMIDEPEFLTLACHDGRPWQKTNLVATPCQLPPLNIPPAILTAVAIDFSACNWDTHLHKGRVLHATSGMRTSPYEEALALAIEVLRELPSQSRPIMHGFGSPATDGMIQSEMDSEETLTIYKLWAEEARSRVVGCVSSLNLSCVGFGRAEARGSKILPIISELVRMAADGGGCFIVASILLDGQVADCKEAHKFLSRNSYLPLSITFIAVGFADTAILDALESAEMPRKMITIIRFRTFASWSCSLKNASFTSFPRDIFRKEMVNGVSEHVKSYLLARADNPIPLPPPRGHFIGIETSIVGPSNKTMKTNSCSTSVGPSRSQSPPAIVIKSRPESPTNSSQNYHKTL